MFILPINKDGYVGKRPYVFIALAILNGVFLAAIYMFSTERAVFELYGFTPATPTIKTLFTSMFLHAGILHYAGNMFFLWMFGYRVENTFGRSLFIIVYLVCGIGATAAHYIFNATSAVPCVGASGAISGIVGCYFVLFPRSRFNIEIYLIRFKVKTIESRTHVAVGAWIAEQTLLGLTVGRFSSTAFWAHVGGFVTGAGLAYLLVHFVPELPQRGDNPLFMRRVRGFVSDSNGKPLHLARVELTSPDGKTFVSSTDQRGYFHVDQASQGRHYLTVHFGDLLRYDAVIIVDEARRPDAPLAIRMATAEKDKAMTAGHGY